MPNIQVILKEEIARVARKEIKSDTDALRKSLSAHRAQIAALRKRVDELERSLKRAAKVGRSVRSAPDQDEPSSEGSLRFRAAGFAAHRQRLGLSAADLAKLLGVSSLSVYKWEAGKTRPRAAQLARIAEVRKLSKREAHARLEAQASRADNRKAA